MDPKISERNTGPLPQNAGGINQIVELLLREKNLDEILSSLLRLQKPSPLPELRRILEG
jgi:hypothetical protein